MRIAVLKETAPGETRVALTPETARKFIALGATVAVESGAGVTASIPDAAYAEAGTPVNLMVRGKALGGSIVPLPFVPHRYAGVRPRGSDTVTKP